MSYVDNARIELLYALNEGCPEHLLNLYTLLVLVKGDEVSLEDVHDAWSIWEARTDPSHRSIVPFDQLTQDVQEMDRPYAEAISIAARRVKRVEQEPGGWPRVEEVDHQRLS